MYMKMRDKNGNIETADIEIETLEYFSNFEEERNLTRCQGVKIYNPDTGCFVPGCYQRLAHVGAE